MPLAGKVRVYDLAREIKQDTKRVMEDLRREGADVSVPSNSVNKELAEKIRNKYFPKVEAAPKRLIRVIKKQEKPTAEEDLQETETKFPEMLEATPKHLASQIKVLEKKPEIKDKELTIVEDIKPSVPFVAEINHNEIPLELTENKYKGLSGEISTNSQVEKSNDVFIIELKVDCRECRRPTKHNLKYSVETVDVEWNEKYQIVQCMGCESISFRRIIFKNINQSDNKEEIDLYPSRIKGRHKLQLDSIPPTIAQIYEEIHLALSNRLLIVATTGMRTLIEAVCNNLNSSGRNLKDKIDTLVNMQLLTPKNALNLHKLRDFGNAAAHEANSQSEDTLNKCIDIIEHLLKDVYSPDIFS